MKTDELGNEFFDLLKPRLRHRLISLLFNPFITKFYYMFFDDYSEAGTEFKNDFIFLHHEWQESYIETCKNSLHVTHCVKVGRDLKG